MRGTEGIERVLTRARLQARRLVVPDENATWALTAVPAAIRIVREHGIDVVRLDLAAAGRRTSSGLRWRGRPASAGSPTSATRSLAHAHRRADTTATRAKAGMHRRVARLVASYADAITCVSEAISRGDRGLSPRGPVVTIPNGCDFDDVAGLERHPSDRFRITHTGSFFGRRDPRPFLQALARLGARHRGALPRGLPRDRPRLGRPARARRPARADPLRAAVRVARAPARLRGAAAADPRGGRTGEGRALGQGLRVHRRRPPDPRRRPAGRSRRGADPRDRRGRRRAARRPACDPRGARGAPRLAGASGGLPDVELSEEWHDRLSRRTRVEEMAAVLRGTYLARDVGSCAAEGLGWLAARTAMPRLVGGVLRRGHASVARRRPLPGSVPRRQRDARTRTRRSTTSTVRSGAGTRSSSNQAVDDRGARLIPTDETFEVAVGEPQPGWTQLSTPTFDRRRFLRSFLLPRRSSAGRALGDLLRAATELRIPARDGRVGGRGGLSILRRRT